MTQAKEFIFEDAARDKLKSGIETLANLTCVTLGPKGRSVGLSTALGAPSITSDGYSIVKHVELQDLYLNMGVQIGRELADKMKQLCGDGTTTAIILLNALTQGGVKLIPSGASPILIKRGMDAALVLINQQIDKLSQKIKEDDEILNIAQAAASGSLDIATTIANAFKKVNRDGVILIEDGKSAEDVVEHREGLQINSGYLSPHFCTNRDNSELELTCPKILIVDKKIHSIHELLPILQQIAITGSSLLIIAEDIESDVLSTLVINSLRGILKVAAIKAPSFGANRRAILEDLAVLSGAAVMSDDTGILLKDITIEHLGEFEKVIISKDKTTFTQDGKYKTQVTSRIKHIENLIKISSSDYEKDKLIERKSKLSGGIAVIHVGGFSDLEITKKKQLYQDALNSTQSAIDGGIVIGAGMSLVHAALNTKCELDGDEKLGFDLVIKAVKAPALQLIKNAGFDPATTLDQALSKGENFGLNAIKEEIQDLKISGIFDATKLVKTALALAISTAGIVLLSEVLIGDVPTDQTQIFETH